MAKRKYHNSSRSHCPNLFGGLLDLGEAFILDCYPAKYRERRRASGNPLRIDPYAAAGAAMGMGRLNSFDDIMRLGGILGSLGAFDPPVHRTPSSCDPPQPDTERFRHIQPPNLSAALPLRAKGQLLCLAPFLRGWLRLWHRPREL